MMSVGQFISENKLISSILTVIFGLLISWGSWVTVSIYSLNQCQAVEVATNNEIVRRLEGLQKQVTTNRDLSLARDDKIMDKLIEIHRDMRRK